jgi:hypothetical protein
VKLIHRLRLKLLAAAAAAVLILIGSAGKVEIGEDTNSTDGSESSIPAARSAAATLVELRQVGRADR